MRAWLAEAEAAAACRTLICATTSFTTVAGPKRCRRTRTCSSCLTAVADGDRLRRRGSLSRSSKPVLLCHGPKAGSQPERLSLTPDAAGARKPGRSRCRSAGGEVVVVDFACAESWATITPCQRGSIEDQNEPGCTPPNRVSPGTAWVWWRTPSHRRSQRLSVFGRSSWCWPPPGTCLSGRCSRWTVGPARGTCAAWRSDPLRYRAPTAYRRIKACQHTTSHIQ